MARDWRDPACSMLCKQCMQCNRRQSPNMHHMEASVERETLHQLHKLVVFLVCCPTQLWGLWVGQCCSISCAGIAQVIVTEHVEILTIRSILLQVYKAFDEEEGTEVAWNQVQLLYLAACG